MKSKNCIYPALLVFYCCVPNLHKLSDLKTPLINTSQFWRSEVPVGSAGFSARGRGGGGVLTRPKPRIWQAGFLSRVAGEESTSKFRLLAELSSHGCRTVVPALLGLSALKCSLGCLPCGLLHGQCQAEQFASSYSTRESPLEGPSPSF